MSALDILASYCPTGTTEGERLILRKAFVELEDYADLITPPPQSPRLLVGKKGSGKSAVIDFSMALLANTKVPAIQLKPSDIEFGSIQESASVGEVTRVALLELTRAVARALGSSASGLISQQDKVLYDAAVSDGLRDRDTVEKLAVLLPKLAKQVTNADLSALLPSSSPAHRNQLLRAIDANLKKSGAVFYLFIDDTDQVAAPDRVGHLNRIWGFLLAARELCQKLDSLRCVISLREEVWRRITSDRAGQRDQTDHFFGLVRFLNPTRPHISRIVEKRISLAAAEADLAQQGWTAFFDPSDPKIPMSNERSNWSDLIVIRSRERPRDAIQLVNTLAQAAKRGGSEKISDELFAKEMVEFSRQRVSLLAQESEFECPQLEAVLRTFSDIDYDHGSFKATSENVRRHLKSRAAGAGLQLFGKAVKPGDEDDVFILWKYLFDIGFLNARIADNREKDGYRHVFPSEDPGLVSRARWNDMQAVVWEIGAAYRDFLIDLQKQHSAQTGLPPARRKKRTRER